MHAPPPLPAESFGRLGAREFVVMMASVQALQALAIDMMLPALGTIASDLGARGPNARQLVVGLFLLGAGLGALLPGALADRFGRRPALLATLGIYVSMSLACVLVTSFEALLAVRLVQAVGSAGLAVLPMAIVRDRFEGDRMARTQSTIAMIFMIVPMIAPSLGQAVLEFGSWRLIFGIMALWASLVLGWVWMRLPETMHAEHRQPIRLAVVARNTVRAVASRSALGYIFGSTLILGAMWGYIQSSQQLVAEHFGAGEAFPTIFGAMALCMATSSFANSRIVERFGARRVSHAAVLAFIAITSVMAWEAWRGGLTLFNFVPLMTLAMCMMGFIGANFGSIALQPFARIAGAAASAHAFTRMVIASLIGAAVGQAYDGTARPLAAAMLAAGIAALGLVLFSERGRLFRRIHPVGAVREVPIP